MIRLSLDEGAAPFEDDIRELIKPFFLEESFEIHSPAGTHYAERGREAGASCSPEGNTHTCNGTGASAYPAGSGAEALGNPPALRQQGVEIGGGDAPYIHLHAGELPLSGDRKEDKGLVKTALYRALSAYTGRELPWGALTGIRPVTLASPLIEEAVQQAGGGELGDAQLSGIRDKLRDAYLLSEGKLDLLLEIALREQRILKDLERRSGKPYREGWSLYIGIPFCPTRCLYCSFTSEPVGKWESLLPDYLSALRREIRFCMQALCGDQGKYLQSLYVGGGTPTALPEPMLQQLMEIIEEECFRHPGSRICEYTVEAGRPDSITREKLRILREAGVGRISINPQSFVDETLSRIGRRHSAAEVEEAFGMAREGGFSNINMDIILGLPGEGLPALRHTLGRVRALRPESLTVHSLALKRAARLNTERAQWAEAYRADEGEMERMMREAADMASHLSLRPYYLYRQKNMAGNLENVGYSREGSVCVYNVLMMSARHTVMGCGAGAASKAVFYGDAGGQAAGDAEYDLAGVRIARCDNGKDIRNYMEHLETMLERKRQIFS